MIDRLIKNSKLTIFFIFVILYVLPLAVRPIIMPDETRYGEIPREMILSGDWIVPHINGVDYFEKPVLGYWMIALSMKLFGENSFAIRFPFVLSTGLCAIFVFMLLLKFGRDKRTASLGALIYLSCFEVFTVGVVSVLDSAFALFFCGVMVCFFNAYQSPGKSREQNLFLILSGISCGLAFLTKGFLAFVLPIIIIIPFLMWEKNLAWIVKKIWLPLFSAIVVILPWAVMIHLRCHDFWHFFIWNEHIRRFISTNAQHRAPFWYFFLVFPAGAIPWIFLFPAAVSGLKRQKNQSLFLRYNVFWFTIPFLFFSFCRGKLATYILPCFVPFAVIMAEGLNNYLKAGEEKLLQRGMKVLTYVLLLFIIALVLMQQGWLGIKLYAQTAKGLLAAAALLTFMIMIISSLREPDRQKKIYKYVFAPLLFLFCAHFLMPDETISRKAPGAFLKKEIVNIYRESILVSDDFSIQAACWFLKRDDVYQLDKGGELMYGLTREQSGKRLLDFAGFRELVNKYSGIKQVVLFARTKTYEYWKPQLPKPNKEIRNQGNSFVLAFY